MTRLWTTLRTASSLGLGPVARVMAYRGSVRTRLHPVCRLASDIADGPFFAPHGSTSRAAVPGPGPDEVLLFGKIPVSLGGEPPDWHVNVLSGARLSNGGAPWWRIPDFDPAAGDIKGVWEASRFAWAPLMAQRIVVGDRDGRDRLDRWLRDWCTHNPPYVGPNWKCGQEASIRVLHLAAAVLILDEWRDPGDALVSLLRAHLRRIEATLSYGIAQDNNHGTSESAALFVAGIWLRLAGIAGGAHWEQLGRRWLENRVQRLIAADGTFSQYSVNYHRLVLDTLALVETWRTRTAQEAFSPGFYSRARAATNWLWTLTDDVSGDAPNLGANDGAWLIPLAGANYRDFRPAVQLAAALFMQCNAYGDAFNEPLDWLSVPAGTTRLPPRTTARLDDGGLAFLRSGDAAATVRYPRFRFRPGHADALHLDLWIDGTNHLRDGGSYLYGTDRRWGEYFAGTASHNTVEFDGRDQMPRLGRFLFGEWLTTSELEAIDMTDQGASFGAAYVDHLGARHHRRVTLGSRLLEVEDHVSGFRSRAMLRWRLMPGDWRLEDGGARNGGISLTVESTAANVRTALVEGWESRYYGSITTLPVLEVEVVEACSIRSRYEW